MFILLTLMFGVTQTHRVARVWREKDGDSGEEERQRNRGGSSMWGGVSELKCCVGSEDDCSVWGVN